MLSRLLLTLSILALVLLPALGVAQTPATTPNPFELEHRLREALAELANSGGQGTNLISLPMNPFDVVPHKAPTSAVQEPKVKNKKGKLELRPQPYTRKVFVLGLLFSLVAFLGLTFSLRRAVASKTWQAFFSNNFLKQAQRDYSGMIGAAPYYLLYVHFIINLGLFVFLTIRAFTGNQFNSFPFMLLCIGAVGGGYLLKHLVVSVSGSLFDAKEQASQYNFLILVFSCILGLFLLPANFFLALRENTSTILPFWVASMILVFYVFRWFRSVGLFGSFVAKNLFHFLLYLCAVEILPAAILIKMLLNNLA
jgi:Domain of unknown function (DUF4271)